jgi:hypothetical protein
MSGPESLTAPQATQGNGAATAHPGQRATRLVGDLAARTAIDADAGGISKGAVATIVRPGGACVRPPWFPRPIIAFWRRS